jgi:TRAP-type mannitol/chloroaromatic compound transport system permease small subunit
VKKFETIINSISKWSGSIASYICLPLMAVIVYSVVARYVFGKPPQWGYDLSRELFGAFIVLGGSYVAMKGNLINVDILWKRLPPRIGAMVNMVTYLFGFVFLVSLFWKSIPQAVLSTRIMEKSMDLTIYLFPLRILFVIGCFLFIVQLILIYIKNIKIVFKKEEQPKNLTIPDNGEVL